MSDIRSTFTQSNLERQHEKEKESEFPHKVRSFELNELNLQSSSMRRGFTYDSEDARNFDDTNVKKAKQGVKELLKDAMDKAKRQSIEIKAFAKKEGHDAGYNEGFKKGEDAVKDKRYRDATSYYDQILEQNPNSIGALVNNALVLQKLKKNMIIHTISKYLLVKITNPEF